QAWGGPGAGGADGAEAVVGAEGEDLEGEPEGACRRPRPRALQADLAEVEAVRGEVGVGRVVAVEPADGGVAEEDAAAAVGLEPMLVGVHDDRVGPGDGAEMLGREIRWTVDGGR